jgi:hypothetical protein
LAGFSALSRIKIKITCYKIKENPDITNEHRNFNQFDEIAKSTSRCGLDLTADWISAAID